jgi:eukaryotic-like serine/threonine-protein kinase
MPLTSGAKLGPYEILSPLGAGGMGEVYRARDTRLDRIVAIKILPSHLSHDPTLRQRFEREAKTISSLNDPHICILYDVGQQGGADYLVMEYLEGETLAQRLQKGPLPLEQALLYAIQIAGALDKAHRKGVTHRDLKPGNIMLTKTGTKLLDFGLAKLEQEAGPPAALSQLPTTAQGNLTAQGTIVGTLQYMAPEQLEGGGVDARTDIFAFGAVVYEMVTGKKAFEGKGQASVIAAILGRDPPAISSLQSKTPPELDRVVKKCLAKEPEQRWQGAGDLCDELKWIAEGDGQLALAPTAVAKGIRAGGRVALLWGVIALLVAAIIGLAVWNLKPTPPPPVIRAVITLPPGQQLVVPDQPAVALSPDGTKLVYVAIQGATQQLYLRAMDSLEATPVPNTDGATIPFFSPDSQSLGFFAGGKLKKVSMSQGSAQSLADAKFPRGASWTSQGMIVFCPTAFGTIDQVSEAGGTPQPLTHFEKGAMIYGWPDLLPGGKEVVFASSENPGNWTNAHILVQSMETGVRRVLAEVGSQPRYAASGHLIFAQSGTLMAVPFNDQRLEVAGAAVPVVEGILQSPATGDAQYSISNTGSLVYVPGHVRAAQRQLVWVNRKGVEQTTGAPERSYRFPRVSPNNRQVAATIDDQESQVWLYDLSRETLTRLTSEGNTNLAPAWTPDGNRISFQSNKTGPANIYWQPADGSSGMERLTSHDITQVPSSWTPDGKFLAYIETTPTTGYDIWVLRLSDRKAQPFLQTPFNESAPRFSPDGRWLAYVSDESGRYEVYVQPFPGPGGKYPISTEGGTEPVWNPKGRELFYRSGDKMMAVDIATQPSFSAGKPKVLFEGHYQPTPLTFPNYDVSPDGQRFLMLKPVEAGEGAPTQIDVVLNWFEELKRRVPAGKK